MDSFRLVFDKLHAAGLPDANARERIYAECREEVQAAYTAKDERDRALIELDKVIRRQEMQALHEESLHGQ